MRRYGRDLRISGGNDLAQLHERFKSGTDVHDDLRHRLAFGVAYIAHRGVSGSTSVNIAINVIQITALLVFSVMAFTYRANHPAGSPALQL